LIVVPAGTDVPAAGSTPRGAKPECTLATFM